MIIYIVTQKCIHIDNLKLSKSYADLLRLNGFCGLAGLNKVCVNGLEVGTEK
jgi:hypothetical protein